VVRVWERGAGTPALTLQGGRIEPGQDPKYEVDFSPDGTKIAVGGPDVRVRIWDTKSGKVVDTFSTPASDVFSTRWSPDGTRIACTGWGWALVWEVSTGKTVKCASRTINDLRMWGLAWSPSGDRVATCGDDSKLTVWDPASGRVLTETRSVAGMHDLCWSPDGRQIASTGWDGLARVWDAGTGQEVLTLRGHAASLHSVGWSPDGKRIATGSMDRTVKLWDSASGQETLTLRGHQEAVWGIYWHSDGCRLATRDGRGNVLVWDATPGFLGARSGATLPGLDERIRRDPADTAARRLRAEVLARQGDWDASAADFTQLVRRPGSGATVYPAGWWVLAGSAGGPPTISPMAEAVPAQWIARADDPNGFVSLPTDGTIAFSRIFFPRKMSAVLDIGPDRPDRAWLNEVQLEPPVSGPIRVELREGWNVLAIRARPGTRFVRLLDGPASVPLRPASE
jgi:dipeptidyl aminopeptidase/acylaminoacyl peptidase